MERWAGLKLGIEVGRGAHGQVFRATDPLTGGTVAVKQLSGARSSHRLASLIGEVQLLQSLSHPHVVKYLGSYRTSHGLAIVMEYMEGGSLASVIKQCGQLMCQEEVVAAYIMQVLEGLSYLHQQGVVHRDIKGANILTTKEGVVKLGDFGVAAKLAELEEKREDARQHIVGTPYWMAPEVIEMTQTTAASDIWSVGCVVVEILTGHPPYFELQPMSALFRIVQDDHPALPQGISPLLQDFLLQCFNKDPKQRPSATALLQHRWIWEKRQSLRASWRTVSAALGVERNGGWSASARDQEVPEVATGGRAGHEVLSSVVNRLLEEQERAAAELLAEAASINAAATNGGSGAAAAAAAGSSVGVRASGSTVAAADVDIGGEEEGVLGSADGTVEVGVRAQGQDKAKSPQQQPHQLRRSAPAPGPLQAGAAGAGQGMLGSGRGAVGSVRSAASSGGDAPGSMQDTVAGARERPISAQATATGARGAAGSWWEGEPQAVLVLPGARPRARLHTTEPGAAVAHSAAGAAPGLGSRLGSGSGSGEQGASPAAAAAGGGQREMVTAGGTAARDVPPARRSEEAGSSAAAAAWRVRVAASSRPSASPLPSSAALQRQPQPWPLPQALVLSSHHSPAASSITASSSQSSSAHPTLSPSSSAYQTSSHSSSAYHTVASLPAELPHSSAPSAPDPRSSWGTATIQYSSGRQAAASILNAVRNAALEATSDTHNGQETDNVEGPAAGEQQQVTERALHADAGLGSDTGDRATSQDVGSIGALNGALNGSLLIASSRRHTLSSAGGVGRVAQAGAAGEEEAARTTGGSGGFVQAAAEQEEAARTRGGGGRAAAEAVGRSDGGADNVSPGNSSPRGGSRAWVGEVQAHGEEGAEVAADAGPETGRSRPAEGEVGAAPAAELPESVDRLREGESPSAAAAGGRSPLQRVVCGLEGGHAFLTNGLLESAPQSGSGGSNGSPHLYGLSSPQQLQRQHSLGDLLTVGEAAGPACPYLSGVSAAVGGQGGEPARQGQGAAGAENLTGPSQEARQKVVALVQDLRPQGDAVHAAPSTVAPLATAAATAAAAAAAAPFACSRAALSTGGLVPTLPLSRGACGAAPSGCCTCACGKLRELLLLGLPSQARQYKQLLLDEGGVLALLYMLEAGSAKDAECALSLLHVMVHEDLLLLGTLGLMGLVPLVFRFLQPPLLPGGGPFTSQAGQPGASMGSLAVGGGGGGTAVVGQGLARPLRPVGGSLVGTSPAASAGAGVAVPSAAQAVAAQMVLPVAAPGLRGAVAWGVGPNTAPLGNRQTAVTLPATAAAAQGVDVGAGAGLARGGTASGAAGSAGAAAGGGSPSGLRLQAALFVERLCFASDESLRLFVACQGLKHLVAMVWDADTDAPSTLSTPHPPVPSPSPLLDGSSLTHIALSCIWRVLEALSKGYMPLTGLCRLLAQQGLVERLFLVLREAIQQHAHRTGLPASVATASAGAAFIAANAPRLPAAAAVPATTAAAAASGVAGVAGMSGPGTGAAGGSSASGSAAASRDASAPGYAPDQADPGRRNATAGQGLAQGPGAGVQDKGWPAVGHRGGEGEASGRQGEADVASGPQLCDPYAADPVLWAMHESVKLLLVLSQADAAVKAYVCEGANPRHLLHCVNHLQQPCLVKLLKALRCLTTEPSVVPAIRDAGAVPCLVPFLSATWQLQEGGTQVQLEALAALYNICIRNKANLEVAAAAGVTPHLCRMAREAPSPLPQQQQQQQQQQQRQQRQQAVANDTMRALGQLNQAATAATATAASVHQSAQSAAGRDGALERPGAAQGRSKAREWCRRRPLVVPLLVELVGCSPASRARLWASEGMDILLKLLQDQEWQVCVLKAIDTWLAEDHTRAEGKLTQREPVAALVDLYARTHQSGDARAVPQLLDTLRQMLGRSPSLAVALALGGLVPWLLSMMERQAPAIRVQLLEIIRCLYEHYPRPKEFIVVYSIPEVLRRLLETRESGSEAVHAACHQLLSAFQINVLL